ncbi:MAG: NAD(P)H-binding protein [Gemmatimonadota bacterium]|jgi:uncharacterized protein YbjT (DUF2867 family)
MIDDGQGRILVTGATGTVGAYLLDELVRRGVSVRGASRDVERARTEKPRLEWADFDLTRPETFAPALEGVDRVFLIARPGDDDPERTARPFVKAMAMAGVGQAVTLSAMGAERRDDITLDRMERLVEEAGLAWTHLRPNWFMQVFAVPPLVHAISATGRIEIPAADARISWIDARDVAAVAATVLTESSHEGRAYLLTGGEALDHARVAEILSRASGRDIEYCALDESEGRERVLAAGLGPRRAERLTRFYRHVRAGACAPVSHDVAQIVGRPPITFERFAEEHRDSWAPGARVAAAAQ